MPRVPDSQIERIATDAGLSPRDVADVVDAYNLAVVTEGADNWTTSQARNWMAEEVSTRGGDTTVVLDQPREDRNATSDDLPFASAVGRYFGGDDDAIRFDQARQVADDATQRSQRVRDRFYRAADMFFDSGPAFDPDAMAQSLAVGVFTDASGNPVIDPNTGQPTPVDATTLWQAIKGQTFDMGQLSMPRARGRRDPRGGARAGREGADDARLARLGAISSERRRFVTPSMAMALLGSMPEDYLTHLQQQLWEAGLFGEDPPSWGRADDATRRAYMALFAEASLTPDDTIDRVLARMTDEAVTRGTTGGAAAENQIPAFAPEVASAESLAQLIDDRAQALLGRFATDDEKKLLTAALQQGETDVQRAQYDRDVAEATGGTGPGGLDAFMAAIAAQESGGDYTAQNAGSGAYGKFQIMPANWGPWAERAGIGRSAPRTPENQEIVARHVMTEYYQRFGNWRDVAIAWFAGPGAVGKANAESRSDGNMTVRQYADRAVQRMADMGGGRAPGSRPGEAAPIETWDAAAEAEAALKAADPTGWEGNQWGERAIEFFSLLGGVA